MPFALLIIGIVLIAAAIRDTVSELIQLLKIDFTGRGNFAYWIVALVAVGSIGYVGKLKPLSDGLLILIILTLFLTKGNPKLPGGGFFQQFSAALGSTTSGVGGGVSLTTPGNSIVSINLPGLGTPAP